MENGKADKIKQSKKQDKRNQRRSEPPPREGIEMKENTISILLNLIMTTKRETIFKEVYNTQLL